MTQPENEGCEKHNLEDVGVSPGALCGAVEITRNDS